MKYSPEEINKIIGFKGADGKSVNIFDLHGLLYIGNSENGIWDLSKTYLKFSEHNLGIDIKDFEDCQTIDEVNEVFMEQLKEVVCRRLI